MNGYDETDHEEIRAQRREAESEGQIEHDAERLAGMIEDALANGARVACEAGKLRATAQEITDWLTSRGVRVTFPPIVARITASPQGFLTDDSTVSITGGPQNYPIPSKTKVGGILAPIRIFETLASLGYRPARGAEWVTGDGWTEIEVVPSR